MGDPKDELPSEAAIWTDLVRWVQGGDDEGNDKNTSSGYGGYVHPSLTLRGTGPSRGVEAVASIAKGELLVRISSRHVLSGETETAHNETGKTTTTTASPWLKCVGAFLKAKRDKTTVIENSVGAKTDYGPYLNSLPKLKDYETLHNWSTKTDEVQSFLRGTTLGTLVALDRSTKGIQTRYRNSVEPYLIKTGAITKGGNNAASLNADAENSTVDKEKAIETSEDYQAFLETSMCISTRGFHLLPSASESCEQTETRGEATIPSTKTNSYDGPFMLPIIDLLNHDPQNSCTTLRRHQSTRINGDSYFAMVAERDIAQGEEIFHSYGSDLTSAQLLQTFGFVPRKHSIDALAAVVGDSLKVSQSFTPVGFSTKDHLIAASRSLKASSFPDTVMDRIRVQSGDSTEADVSYVEVDEDDCFWEVCDIPDRPRIASSDEFLVSASQMGDLGRTYLLTEDIVTLMAAQFLPEDAFEEIFPSGDDNSNTVQLDRSILIEDYYLGVLVCKSLLVACFLKARAYVCNGDDEEIKPKSSKEELAEFVAKAISVATHSGFVGRYISSLLQTEITRIRELLGTKNAENTTSKLREIYGRTIRTEEMTNLLSFCKEIEGLMAMISLDGDAMDAAKKVNRTNEQE
eukprot:CAMPEP_0116082618 /NCGR_PEP_ID=MMETSP0327-20121206/2825_1 /TAXON_ID=44447 /ORGANISM="Pseudo-nitzschia delicatissima, Strain B596" /LENGTH=631 /DNA_ID=CAMNT_0003573429 /DNA_START=94 /DNA_END=1990 /DNA_ORIENTATION=-